MKHPYEAFDAHATHTVPGYDRWARTEISCTNVLLSEGGPVQYGKDICIAQEGLSQGVSQEE